VRNVGFHQYYDTGATAYDVVGVRRTRTRERSLRYDFRAHFHPFVTELVRRLTVGSVAGLQDADTDPALREEIFSATRYAPSDVVDRPYPVKDLDFGTGGAYAVYNWELFYHVPITVAIHLSRNGRYEDAQRWFHYVFDPTDNGAGPTPDRFWKVKPFRGADVTLIESVLVNLSTGADPQLFQTTMNSIKAWQANPFHPHVVARYRPTAYMFKTVTAYLDNLIAWGDALFREDTGESVNEATQLYVLAANVLGPRPQEVPRKDWQRAQTYEDLRGDLDAMSNAIREVEADIPFDLSAPPPAGDDAPLATLRTLGASLYFCVPRNDKLLGYWDTVADRLFKIRNSLNLQGVFRQLPLFEPPIDPALLARAAAGGVDVGAVVSGLYQPLPLVRFRVLVAKAGEICQEVVALGAQLLAAMEKQDGEALAALRARQERVVLELAEVVRYQQWQEARKTREGLEASLATAIVRYTHYERLLGTAPADVTVPSMDPIDADALAGKRFSASEPVLPQRPVTVSIAQSVVAEASGHQLSPEEATELAKLADAQRLQRSAAGKEQLGSLMGLIPTFGARFEPLGAGGTISFGGNNLAAFFTLMANADKTSAAQSTFEAGQSAKIGGYARREQEWALQSNLAASDISATFKQLRAAQLREAIAEREWHNHQRQIDHAEEVEAFLAGKTTTEAFYAWMRREARGLYSRCFALAFDVARKAERALQHELGDPSRTFLQYDYLAGREELLAGERLRLDVARMELAHHELNAREYELTRHVSLRQLDPRALVELRTTGQCTVDLPEALFDLDCPGHYFRRIRSVALSIPCVAGPYASVSCTLTLLKSSVRISPSVAGGYARAESDARFSDHYGGVQAIVTSTANNDSGLFETMPGDDRYLPFEGSGAVSRWRLELPADVPQFDHASITDAVLHMKYQAREGGQPLRGAAVTDLRERIAAAATVGSVRLVHVPTEFPGEWARFRSSTVDGPVPLTFTLRQEHYPYWARGVDGMALRRVEVIASAGAGDLSVYDRAADEPPGSRHETVLTADDSVGGLRTGLLAAPLPPAVGEVTLYVADTAISDLWLALAWGGPA
jgi:hypothetical protein